MRGHSRAYIPGIKLGFMNAEKGKWLKEVVKLNPELFTQLEKENVKERWARYFELRKTGVALQLPKRGV